mgnify:CR=1 FL=1
MARRPSLVPRRWPRPTLGRLVHSRRRENFCESANMTVPMLSEARSPSSARSAWTPNQPRLRRMSGKLLRKASAEREPTTWRMEERTAAPSLPKSRLKMAKGSDEGSAMEAPASAVSAVLVGTESERSGAGIAAAAARHEGLRYTEVLMTACYVYVGSVYVR